MLDFILNDGKELILDDIADEILNVQMYSEDGEQIGEVNWNINSVAEFLFCEDN